jgi:GxxExxY protein
MPIICPVPSRHISQKEFAKLDFQVMRLAFESQNELGRLCDETIYRNDLLARIAAAGLGPVHQEVPVTVTHNGFEKLYRLDLLVGESTVYELKTDSTLVREHEAQLLNYLFLRGAQHGKLVNFRPAKVQSRFVNTQISEDARRRFHLRMERWGPDRPSQALSEVMISLLKDWGMFLELGVYQDAPIHFLGGEEKVSATIPVCRNGIPLGNQRIHLLDSETGFRLTAMAADAEDYERQISLLLQHTQLRAVHWINLAHHTVDFVTLTR